MALHALNYFFGPKDSSAPSPVPTDDAFADFANTPLPPSHAAASSAFTAASNTRLPSAVGTGFFDSPFGIQGRPYTKWYRVWERVTIHDFYQEFLILPILLVVVMVNWWGTRMNRRKVQDWAKTFLPIVEQEYASVGFDSSSTPGGSIAKAIEESKSGLPDSILRQKKKNEYFTYATGRQNIAWLDLKLTLYKRFNPFVWFLEAAISFFFESIPSPEEKMEATAYCFDGKEKQVAPEAGNSATGGSVSIANSVFDGFVWAIVHKDKMQRLRSERYDLSLTFTRDHAKLPEWATIMSESAEITDALVTAEVVKAVEECGEGLEALIISDMPIDAPKKLDDLVPRKRVLLTLTPPSLVPTPTLPSHLLVPNPLPLFTYFLHLPDILVTTAHFRPEAMRKIRGTREEEVRKIKKVDEEEKAEERKSVSDKVKKEERERKLKGMSAEEQRKFLEGEAERERRKGNKKRTVKG